jgi:hypothetical protein
MSNSAYEAWIEHFDPHVCREFYLTNPAKCVECGKAQVKNVVGARTGCSWCNDTGLLGPLDDQYVCPCPAGQLNESHENNMRLVKKFGAGLRAINNALGIEYDDLREGWWVPAEPGPILCDTLEAALRRVVQFAEDEIAELEKQLAAEQAKPRMNAPGTGSGKTQNKQRLRARQKEERTRLRAEVAAWEELEARLCPEDMGFEEYIARLTRRLTIAESALDGYRNFTWPDGSSEDAGEAARRLQKENWLLREMVWLNHGHQGLYGDDGELQCNECPLDFKRDSVDHIIGTITINTLRKLSIPQNAGG